MKMGRFACAKLCRYGAAPALLALTLGCVNLDQPKEVNSCLVSGEGCQNPPPAKPVPDPSTEHNAIPDAAPALSDGPTVLIPPTSDDAAMAPTDEPVALPDSHASIDGVPDRPIDRGGPDGKDVSGGSDVRDTAAGRPELGGEAGRDVGVDLRLDTHDDAAPKFDLPADLRGIPDLGPDNQPDLLSLDTALPDTGNAGGCAVVSDTRFALGTVAATCFVTCDGTEYGWGCSSFGTDPLSGAARTVTVNGTPTTCGGPLPPKKNGYYYFQIGAGGHTWDEVHWSGTIATSCTPPDGGFVP